MPAIKWYWIYPSIILVASLAFLLGKWLFLLGGKAFGRHLIKKSSGRRRALLAKVKLDEKHATNKTRPSLSPKSINGDDREKAEDNWEGIIGFFHPFW